MKQTLESAKIPCQLEPSGPFDSEGKRPDRTSIVSWNEGKALNWHATCPDTLAPSHLKLVVKEAGAVADDAEFRKTQKYSNLTSSHYFVLLAVELLAVSGKEDRSFLKQLGQQVKSSSGDPIAHQYLVQRISVAVQRGNAAAVPGSTGLRDKD